MENKKDEIVTLDFSFSRDKVGYFVLKNKDMDVKKFNDIVKMFAGRAVAPEYYGKASDSFKVIQQDGEFALEVIQNKVPNVVKYLVDSNSQDIQINLTGINPNREVESEMIKKPLDINKVLKLVPYYHPVKTEKLTESKIDVEKMNRK